MPAKAAKSGRSRKPRKTPNRKYYRKTGRHHRSDGGGIAYWPNLRKSMPFPPIKKCIHQWQSVLAITGGINGALGTANIFNLNSLLTPLVGAGVGTQQPMGFDQMALIYNKYKVNAIKLQIEFNDPTADGLFGAIEFTKPSAAAVVTAGALVGDITQYPLVSVIDINNSESQKIALGRYFKMQKLAGVNKLQFAADVDEYTGTSTTSPNRIPALRIATGGYRADANTMIVRVRILYYTMWYSLVNLPASVV